MTVSELSQKIINELDSRKLKNPNIRKNALKKIIDFVYYKKDYIHINQVVLPNKRENFELEYRKYKGKKINGAEKNIIKLFYGIIEIKQKYKPTTYLSQKDFILDSTSKTQINFDKVERNLILTEFYSVSKLPSQHLIPDESGIYCIKLRTDVVLPEKFKTTNKDGIIYIGQASKSLYQRLWEQELNHKKPATFFRSIGAILGFLPPKGSLSKKSKNYKFNKEDTKAIREWMMRSLLINFVSMPYENLNNIEKKLINKYKPIINIKNNPNKNKNLIVAREKCVQYGRMTD